MAATARSGVGSDPDGDLVFLEKVDQPEREVTAFLHSNNRCQLGRSKNPRSATKGLTRHFASLGAHGKLNIRIVQDSLDLPSTRLSRDIDLPINHVEPDRG